MRPTITRRITAQARVAPSFLAALGALAARARWPLLLGLAALGVGAPAARGAGFVLPAPSAQGLGRAGAVVADAPLDPAAVWVNPAEMAFAPGAGAASLGSSFLHLRTRFAPAAGGPEVPSGPEAALVPALFGRLRLATRASVGLGAHVPYGFATRWPAGWAGAQQAIDSRFHAVALTAVLAVRLGERLALAFGPGLLRGDLQAGAALASEVGGAGTVRASGWGYAAPGLPDGLRPLGALAGHLALTYRALPERLHLALVYHARARLPLRGQADFSPVAPAFGAIFADQAVKVDLTLPDVLTLGALYRPHPALSLTVEVERASFGVLERFALDFQGPDTPDLVIERGERNPLAARAGVAGWLPGAPFALRGGVALDGSATAAEHQPPFAPDGRRLGLALGTGTRLGPSQLDVGYLYTHFLSAPARSPRVGPQAPPRGAYQGRLHTLAVTVTVAAR